MVSSLLGPGPGLPGWRQWVPPAQVPDASVWIKLIPHQRCWASDGAQDIVTASPRTVCTSPGPVVPRGVLCCVGGEGMGAEEGS